MASAICYFFVSTVKNGAGYDDSLDVFGIHGIGGITGAIGTGILASPSLGGVGFVAGETMGAQLYAQIMAVVITIVWSGVGTLILLYITRAFVGLRVTEEDERRGLDLTSHGESAYHM